jgi:hypothetical protein
LEANQDVPRVDLIHLAFVGFIVGMDGGLIGGAQRLEHHAGQHLVGLDVQASLHGGSLIQLSRPRLLGENLQLHQLLG